ncbi:MAG: pyrroline-5-carboxylate reductase, partial [Chthoniobacterales bacterium]|nr:pyrroline-5-carboxylate reductase [Chthoniobacterales bacterium]
ELLVVERDEARRSWLQSQFRLDATADLNVLQGDVIVIAIPPQVFADFVASERCRIPENTPIISVMAGIRIATISDALGSDQVVRTIPNTPAEVGRGVTVFYAPSSVTPETLERVHEVLSAIGTSLRVGNEDMLDPATAICGGGPAFVSYFADAFCTFAQIQGFSPDEAVHLTTEVLQGTAQLIATSRRTPEALCREVMTPNGTTERGIAAFEAGRLKPVVLEALAASRRCRGGVRAECAHAFCRDCATGFSSDCRCGRRDDRLRRTRDCNPSQRGGEPHPRRRRVVHFLRKGGRHRWSVVTATTASRPRRDPETTADSDFLV